MNHINDLIFGPTDAPIDDVHAAKRAVMVSLRDCRDDLRSVECDIAALSERAATIRETQRTLLLQMDGLDEKERALRDAYTAEPLAIGDQLPV